MCTTLCSKMMGLCDHPIVVSLFVSKQEKVVPMRHCLYFCRRFTSEGGNHFENPTATCNSNHWIRSSSPSRRTFFLPRAQSSNERESSGQELNQHRPNFERNTMASPAVQAKAQALNTKLEGQARVAIDEMEKLYLRGKARDAYACCVKCYDKAGTAGPLDVLEQCVQRCQIPHQQANNYLQSVSCGTTLKRRLEETIHTHPFKPLSLNNRRLDNSRIA